MNWGKMLVSSTLIVMLFGFTSTYAMECPPFPKQVQQDLIIDAKGKIGSLLNIVEGDFEGRVEKRAHDLFSKYPNADEIVLKNLMTSMFCQMLDESDLEDSEKFDLFFNFNNRVMKFVPPNPRMVAAFYHQLVELETAAKDGRNLGDPLIASLSSIISGLKNELSQDAYLQAVELPESELESALSEKQLGDVGKRNYAKTRASQLATYIRHTYPELIGNDD